MGNLDTLQHSTFRIQHSSLLFVILATVWRRMGSGGLRGLQNRCFGAEASKGWFDSDTPPPFQALVGHDCVVPNPGCGTAAGPYCLGTSVRNPIFIAPPSCAASIASTARSKGI